MSIVKITTISSLIEAGDPTCKVDLKHSRITTNSNSVVSTVPLEVWNVVESSSLMIAATVPMTKPIMTLVFTRVKSLTSYLSGGTSRGTRGTSKGTNPNSLPSGSGFVSSSRKGWQRTDSKEEILLEEVRVDNPSSNHSVV